MRKRIAAIVFSVFMLSALCLPVAAMASAPKAANMEIVTYRNEAYEGKLSAEDDKAGEMSFAITTKPIKGSIELHEDGSFIYTPKEGKRGKDYFGYKATDSEGNISQEATVIIKILKKK